MLMGSFARTLFSRTLLPLPVLPYSGQNLHAEVLEHLVWSNASGFRFWGPLAQTNFLSALCGLPIEIQRSVVPAIPQSEVLAKCLHEISEKCGEILAELFADLLPSICREHGRKKIHKKILNIFPTAPNVILSLLQLLGLGAPTIRDSNFWGP